MKNRNQNRFHSNCHGILSHDGWVKVAESNITSQIISINGDKVQVKGNKGSYVCEVHKNLSKDLLYMDVGDNVLIKFRNGSPYIVGFLKGINVNEEVNSTLDSPIIEDKWVKFFPEGVK